MADFHDWDDIRAELHDGDDAALEVERRRTEDWINAFHREEKRLRLIEATDRTGQGVK